MGTSLRDRSRVVRRCERYRTLKLILFDVPLVTVEENKNKQTQVKKFTRFNFHYFIIFKMNIYKIIIYNKQFDRNKQFITIKQHY